MGDTNPKTNMSIFVTIEAYGGREGGKKKEEKEIRENKASRSLNKKKTTVLKMEGV